MILVSDHVRLTRWVKLIKRALPCSIFDTKTSAYILYKALRTWQCVYYTHTETFIIFPSFKMTECRNLPLHTAKRQRKRSTSVKTYDKNQNEGKNMW